MSAKAVTREKFIAMQAHLKKQRKISNPQSKHTHKGKEKKRSPKSEEIINIGVEINEGH